MPGDIAWGRLFGAAVAAALIAVTVYLAVESRWMYRVVEEAAAARPVSVPIDLSRPGKTTAPLKQTYGSSCHEALFLELLDGDAEERSPDEPLEGLRGTVTITDQAGREVVSVPMPGGMSGTVADFTPMPVGEYELTIEVIQGAPALSGREQRLVGEYVMCGIDRMPAQFTAWLAIAAGVASLVLSLNVILGFARFGRAARTSG